MHSQNQIRDAIKCPVCGKEFEKGSGRLRGKDDETEICTLCFRKAIEALGDAFEKAR